MALTTATVYFRPRWTSARSKDSGAVMFFPARLVSGLYSSALTNSQSKKNWKPSAMTPLVDKDGRITPEWNRYFSDLGGRKLGGALFPTLPDITEIFGLAQSNAKAISAVQTALENQAIANAQALDAIRQVVQNANLDGAAQVPTVILVRQEVTPPPPTALPLVEGGGGGGD